MRQLIGGALLWRMPLTPVGLVRQADRVLLDQGRRNAAKAVAADRIRARERADVAVALEALRLHRTA